MIHENTKMEWIRRANFASLCAWLIASVFIGATSLFWFGGDFRAYYAAARVLLDGGNPYDYAQLGPMLLAVTGHIGHNPYYYPPWFAWFFTPLAWLPFEVARMFWMIFNCSIWIIGLWQLSQLLKWPDQGWRRWLMWLLATVLFARTTLQYEQVGILLFFLFVATLTALQDKNWELAGIWMSLLLIKPNVTFIPVMAISIWLIRRGQWRPVVVMCFLSAGLLVAATVATPDWYRPLLQPGFSRGLAEVLDGPDRVTAAIVVHTTLLDWLKMLQVDDGLSNAIYAVAVIIGGSLIAAIAWRSESLMRVTTASLLVSFAITSYAYQYDFPPLTIVLFWATALCASSKSTLAGGAAITISIASVLFWERLMSDGYWIVIGLSALTIWGWYNVNSQQVPLPLN